MKKYLGLIIGVLIVVVFAFLGSLKANFVVFPLFFLPVAIAVAFKGTKHKPFVYGLYSSLLFCLNDLLLRKVALNQGNPDYVTYLSIIFVLLSTSLVYGLGATAFYCLKTSTIEKKYSIYSLLIYIGITSTYLYAAYFLHLGQ